MLVADARGGRARAGRARSWPRSSATACPPTATTPPPPTPRARAPRARSRRRCRQAGVAPERGRLREQPRHRHGQERPGRDRRHQGRARRGRPRYNTAVSSTKSMIGHLLGGAGAAEAIVTVKALEDQVLPPTANYTEPDPECDLDYVPNEPREAKLDVALSNNFAFGGANASVLFARAGARDDGPAGARPRPRGGHRPRRPDLGGHRPRRALGGVHVGRATAPTSRTARSSGASTSPPPTSSRRRSASAWTGSGVFSIISSRLALEDAGLEVTDDNRTRVGRDPRHGRRPDGEHGGLRDRA